MTTEENAQATSSVEDIEAEIEATREELGATVDALSRKLDVKARAQEKVSAAKENVQAKLTGVGEPIQAHCADAWTQARAAGSQRQVQLAAAAGVLGALVLIAVLRRR